jgi:hypothetical protein
MNSPLQAHALGDSRGRDMLCPYAGRTWAGVAGEDSPLRRRWSK